ncbi:MAG: YggS family pyridoxal phosphate-dependent enzyme [Pseudomonadota bacterium]
MDDAAAARAISDVRARIEAAAAETGRDAAACELIAVSKTFGPDAIRPFLDAGHRHFGENRVQESQGKWPELKAAFPETTLHLIGPLQSNKAKDAVALFDAIHTVDRPKIARAIASEMTNQGRTLELFVQVNTGDEAQKAGVGVDDLADLLAFCRGECGLMIAGLMCIPPIEDAPAPHFALLSKLAAEHGLAKLSMGMSADYETAVQFGASYVRVGSAIFGARAKPVTMAD